MKNEVGKVYFVIKSLSLKGGGAERVFVDILNNFKKDDQKINIITFDKNLKNTFYKLLVKINFKSFFLNDGTKSTSLLLFFKKALIIRKFLLQNKNNFFVCFMSSTFLLFALASFGIKTKIIASEHMIFQYYKKNWLQLLLFFLLYFKLDKVVVVSDQAKKTFPKFLQKKMIVINNTILNVKNFNYQNKNKSNKILLNIGRMEDQKDQISLIKIFNNVKKVIQDAHLNIIGNGNLHLKITQLIAHYKLQESVTIYDYQEDLSKFYLNSFLYVSTSKFESHGLTVSEALNYKLPCLAFKSCEGLNNIIINEKNGFLIEDKKNKIENFSNKIIYCLQNPKIINKISTHIKFSGNNADIYEQWQNLLN
jgi:glycosyltransferase involved in cell wall biosynthesis